jgi:tight adherence protein C
MNQFLLAALTGTVLTFGVWAILRGAIAPVDPRLSDALDLLDGRLLPPPTTTGPDRLGFWLQARLRRPVSQSTARRLRMIGRSGERHFTHKAIGVLIGLIAPLLLAALGAWIVGAGFAVVAVASIPFGVLGFFLPDLLLAAADRDTTEDATEALLTYFDLVTLERLANRSGPQALRAAAAVSDVTVFATIREALERARLEQRAPYSELKSLAAELELPALADIADVMGLDESGASLASTLQARVKELRDAHLTNAKVAAGAVSERMTFFMVMPALVFAGFFLVPPMLRLLAG